MSPIFQIRCHTFTECSEFTSGPSSGTLYRRPLWSQSPAQTHLVVTPSSLPTHLVFVPAVPVSGVSQHAAADALCRRQRTLECTRVPSVSPTPSTVTGSLRQHGSLPGVDGPATTQMLCTPRAYTGLVPSRAPQAVQDADSAPAGRRYLWERGEGGCHGDGPARNAVSSLKARGAESEHTASTGPCGTAALAALGTAVGRPWGGGVPGPECFPVDENNHRRSKGCGDTDEFVTENRIPWGQRQRERPRAAGDGAGLLEPRQRLKTARAAALRPPCHRRPRWGAGDEEPVFPPPATARAPAPRVSQPELSGVATRRLMPSPGPPGSGRGQGTTTALASPVPRSRVPCAGPSAPRGTAGDRPTWAHLAGWQPQSSSPRSGLRGRCW